MKRESGYYWIQYMDEWCIADYDCTDGSWLLDGFFCSDDDFQQIDENQIKRD